MVFATGNSGKLREASEILGKGFELVTPAEMGINEDIPETGATLRANSQQKADYILAKCGTDCFADDTGLEVDALGGAPGVHTARYAGEDKNFDRNMDKLLEELSRKEMEASLMKSMGIAPKKNLRKARFRSVITLILGGKRHFFDGILEGKIARAKAGKGGFGYDPDSKSSTVVEGLRTVKLIGEITRQKGVADEFPLVQSLYRLLYENDTLNNYTLSVLG